MTTFRELREGFALTQADVAAALGISQPSVSQIEKREDMLVSTLAEMVRVLGFELVLVAHSTDCPDLRITLAPKV